MIMWYCTGQRKLFRDVSDGYFVKSNSNSESGSCHDVRLAQQQLEHNPFNSHICGYIYGPPALHIDKKVKIPKKISPENSVADVSNKEYPPENPPSFNAERQSKLPTSSNGSFIFSQQEVLLLLLLLRRHRSRWNTHISTCVYRKS